MFEHGGAEVVVIWLILKALGFSLNYNSFLFAHGKFSFFFISQLFFLEKEKYLFNFLFFAKFAMRF